MEVEAATSATESTTLSKPGSGSESAGGGFVGQASARRRRHPAEMDELRASMLLRGFPLPYLSPKENERIFSSLLARRRLPFVLALAGMDEQDYKVALDWLRRQRRQQQRQQGAIR